MSFFTIPDIENSPVMLNTKLIESITTSDNVITLNMASGREIFTTMPRQILVQMLTKVDVKPEMVQPTTEFAGQEQFTNTNLPIPGEVSKPKGVPNEDNTGNSSRTRVDDGNG